MKKKVLKAKETIRDDSGRTDRDNRSEVRELRRQATRPPNNLETH